MKEKIWVDGREIWVLIESHIAQEVEQDTEKEYFTASYSSVEPVSSSGGILFMEEDRSPTRFQSPVAALEYASEKLLGIL